jgi:D-lactate dehydrogenase
MKIAAFETEPWEAQALGALAPAHDLVCVEAPLSPANVAEHVDCEVATTFLRSQLTAQTLAKLPRLKLLATRSTGVDHIDLDYCRAHGIAVANVPDYGDATVAEHAFALLLAVSRRVVQAAERTRRGDFSTAGLRGFDLAGRTLGVVGAGGIGRHVIGIARGFGMSVLAFDLRPDLAVAQALGFAYASLDEVLTRADVLSLHVPGGAATRDLIGERELARLKPGAVLINTARGGVVNGAGRADRGGAGARRGGDLPPGPGAGAG